MTAVPIFSTQKKKKKKSACDDVHFLKITNALANGQPDKNSSWHLVNNNNNHQRSKHKTYGHLSLGNEINK